MRIFIIAVVAIGLSWSVWLMANILTQLKADAEYGSYKSAYTHEYRQYVYRSFAAGFTIGLDLILIIKFALIG